MEEILDYLDEPLRRVCALATPHPFNPVLEAVRVAAVQGSGPGVEGYTLKVLITDCPWEDNSIERGILESAGFEVARARCKTPDDVIAAGRDANALLVGWVPIDRNVVQELDCCRFLVRYGVGYDNIDVGAEAEAGIAVANNPDYCAEEVATHTLALILACHRQLSPVMHSVRLGVWSPLDVMSPMPQLRTQTLGLVGLGRIGRRVAQMVRPLVGDVLAYDPVLEEGGIRPDDIKLVSFDELLTRADYVSVHCPLNPHTRNLFSEKTLSRMKRGAYLINCSRGGIIDEIALAESLDSKHLGGAALDVFSREPLTMDHPLRRLPNVIITPHAAWYSVEADFLLRANPAHPVIRFFAGETVPLVNNPRPRGAER